MNRPRRLAGLLLAAVLAVSLAACSSGSSSDHYVFHGATRPGTLIPQSQREPAENFSGSLLDGSGTYRLTQDAGKVTVINFWGQWCGPCQTETPQFGLVYDKYKAKDVAFVGIDIKEPGRGLPRQFVAEHHITYPMVYDETGETALRLGNIRTQAVPFTVLLDKAHRVAAVYVLRLAASDLEPLLNTLLSEKSK